MKILTALALLASFSTMAKVTVLNCEFPSVSKQGSIEIAVSELYDADKIELYDGMFTNYDGEDVAFSFSGEEELEWLWYLFLSWDGYYASQDEKGDVNFSLDSDGCDEGYLKLYRKTGYKLGQLHVEHHCSGDVPPTTSKVYCSLSTK